MKNSSRRPGRLRQQVQRLMELTDPVQATALTAAHPRGKDLSERAAWAAYAQHVVDVLSEYFEELRTPHTAEVVITSVERQLRAPASGWEVILDSGYVANWSLKPGEAGGLRVACRRPATDADLEHERELTALIQDGAP
ncbi:hypothetical protein [Streptosporangium sp. CA-115845]|uniref:hypothetical protein n=1 Tax=Streptosporangium sp. CA-115845 TaxID=3240071 RepID=UPI003D8CCC8F